MYLYRLICFAIRIYIYAMYMFYLHVYFCFYFFVVENPMENLTPKIGQISWPDNLVTFLPKTCAAFISQNPGDLDGLTWLIAPNYHPQHVFWISLFLTEKFPTPPHPTHFCSSHLKPVASFLQKHKQKKTRSVDRTFRSLGCAESDEHSWAAWMTTFPTKWSAKGRNTPLKINGWNMIFMEVWFRWFSFLLMGDGWVRFLSPFSSSKGL